MQVKLENGKVVKMKNISIDERDEMLDSVEYFYDEKGIPKGVKMKHSVVTKWIRMGIKGDTSDKFLKTLSLQDRTDIFIQMQEHLMMGEGNASSSK